MNARSRLSRGMGRSTVRKGDYTDMWIAFHCQRVTWRFGTNSVTSNSTVYFIEPTSSAAQDRFERRPSLLGWRIDLAQETICDDESTVAVAGMRARTIDHSAKKPATVQRRDASQLVVAGAPGVAEVLGQ